MKLIEEILLKPREEPGFDYFKERGRYHNRSEPTIRGVLRMIFVESN